ncbi:hypothetical protein F4780DRAFT_738152 [Xylariomycetidae sp. FL0641]|nr:hypothetical protein F4780DRAFT_738152 [Xylariomycetidae sp. FL0641]
MPFRNDGVCNHLRQRGRCWVLGDKGSSPSRCSGPARPLICSRVRYVPVPAFSALIKTSSQNPRSPCLFPTSPDPLHIRRLCRAGKMARDASALSGPCDSPQRCSSPSSSSVSVSDATCARLANLPDSLLTQVFEAVERISRRDLCNVSLVNRRWHDIADAILYKTVQFKQPEHHLAFSDSLSRRKRRGTVIFGLNLEYPDKELSHLELNGHIPASHYEPERFDSLSRTISTMSNLEHLHLSVPVDLLHGIGALFNGPFDLACLKSCSLFFQCADDAYWDLRDTIHIFSHPTLESLVIRRAKLDYRGFDFMERPHETALKTLHLIECDINDDALGDVLEFPEALEEFVMTQSADPSPELEESSDNISDYIIALKEQAASLKTITIDSPTLTGRRPLRMREFEALKTLRMNWDWQLFGKTSKKPRLISVGLPPNLETLEFFDELGTDEEVTDLLEYTLQISDVAAKAIKRKPVARTHQGATKVDRVDTKSGTELTVTSIINGKT